MHPHKRGMSAYTTVIRQSLSFSRVGDDPTRRHTRLFALYFYNMPLHMSACVPIIHNNDTAISNVCRALLFKQTHTHELRTTVQCTLYTLKVRSRQQAAIRLCETRTTRGAFLSEIMAFGMAFSIK